MIYLYDDNDISIDGSTDITFTEDVARRFEAYRWHVVHADGHDPDDVRRAFETGAYPYKDRLGRRAYEAALKRVRVAVRGCVDDGATEGGEHPSPLAVLLESADLSDEDLRWVGGRDHLVVVGDFLDRRSRDREILDLFQRLQQMQW